MYTLQDSQGNLIKVYGTRKIPYKLGKATVKITVVVCDVAYPVIATQQLINKGVSLSFCNTQSFISYQNKIYKMSPAGNHLRLNIRNAIFNLEPEGPSHFKTQKNLSSQISNQKDNSFRFPVTGNPTVTLASNTAVDYQSMTSV